ncbi:PREDICTED: C-C motif chemokine 17-like [Nestor notabilis]|uniref:C-C motif chemokine 17-like n=1 Tax=Nestor notabilis TaxID=176057 RepID=UPI0005235C34|nr:PREDICTED: C-C motif chemokine 17-like [Nestor notabilis]
MFAARTILLLILLLTFSLHHIAAHIMPTECCDMYAQKYVRRMKSFYKTPQDCSLPAVVIVAATGDVVCADPKKLWVKRAIQNLQRKNPPSAVHHLTHTSSPPVSGGS